MPDGSIVMSITAASTIPDVGSIDDSDLVRFIPTSLGSTTTGTFEFYLDGSDVGLTTNEENIDSVEVLEDGTLVVGIAGAGSVTGATTVADHDLLRFVPAALGANTSGIWSMWFDGSDVELATPTEGIVGVSMPRAGTVYLSTKGVFSMGTIIGDGMDVLSCTTPVTGAATSCAATARFWDGSTKGLTGLQIDGMQLRPA
jgi:hypothetical protein